MINVSLTITGVKLNMANNIVAGVVSLTLSVIMVTTILVPTIKGVNTTGWSASEIAMIGLASLASIIGLVYGILAVFGLA